uniref:SANT domain-containing protein n=1 Tax=Heliothis virescens TaxID=7102 RepID=A0A2A4JYD9_HELVI
MASTSSAQPEQEQPDQPEKASDNEAIKNWTQKEKYHLIQALKAYGRREIEKIQEHVETKTYDETKAAIEHYTKIALEHPLFVQKQQDNKQKPSKKHQAPLTGWAKLLTDSLSLNELRTETATAVRMIADLENFPPPECTDNIDFRQVYHQIANAMEGKPITPDLSTTPVLHKCLIETALSSKAFIKTAAYKYILNNVDLSDREINTFPKPTEDYELGILRHLASQRSYNPLKVPEDFLKPSCEVKYEDDKFNTS